MNIDINNIDPKLFEEDDRIEAYLKGKMSAEEEGLFMKELESNPKLKEKAIIMARLVKGLKEVGKEQDEDIQRVIFASSRQEVESATKNATQKDNLVSSPEITANQAQKELENELLIVVELCKQTISELKELRQLTQEEREELRQIQRESAFSKIHLQKNFHASSQTQTQVQTQTQAQAQRTSITQPKQKPKALLRTAKLISIAASVICFVWLGFTYNSYRNTTALGYQYQDVFSSIERGEVRGDGTPSEAEKKLLGLFSNVRENKDLDTTIHKLSLCWELSTMEFLNDYTDFSTEIGWNLAIAHLKNNDKKEAKAVLEKLISISEEGSVVNAKAKELLEKI